MYKIALKALNQEVDQWEGPIAGMDDKSCFVRNRRDKAKARATPVANSRTARSIVRVEIPGRRFPAEVDLDAGEGAS